MADRDGGGGRPVASIMFGRVGARRMPGPSMGVGGSEEYSGSVDVDESLLYSSDLVGGEPPMVGRVGCLANLGGRVDARETWEAPFRSILSHFSCCLARILSVFAFTIRARRASTLLRQNPVRVSF